MIKRIDLLGFAIVILIAFLIASYNASHQRAQALSIVHQSIQSEKRSP